MSKNKYRQVATTSDFDSQSYPTLPYPTQPEGRVVDQGYSAILVNVNSTAVKGSQLGEFCP